MKFFSVVLIFIVFSSCGGFNKVLKSKDLKYKYDKAVQYFKEKKYNYVIQIFDNDFFPQIRDTKDFEEAFYMLAYSHYYEKDYFNAENLFRQFSETFSASPRAVEMEYMRAYTFYKQSPKVDLEQTNTLKTIGMMNSFITKYPQSDKVAEATNIIALCQAKIELKDYKAAQLYYNMEQFKAASVAFNNMLSSFPESDNADSYKYMSIKSYFEYAMLSVYDKKIERLKQVVNDCNEFKDKFPESKFLKDIDKLISNSNSSLKNTKNEQTTQTTGS